MGHNVETCIIELGTKVIMKTPFARAISSIAMVIGLNVTVLIPSSADSDRPSKPTDHVVEFKSTRDSFEAALDAYKKVASTPRAPKSVKDALREVALAAQRKAENERLAALEQVFVSYTDALNRASASYAAAVVTAKKDAVAKNAAKNIQNAAVAAATAAYNSAKADLKPLSKIS
jgi:hypothetical protein